MPIYCEKDLLMDCIIELPISINWKNNSYNLTLVIVDQLAKTVHYKPIKIIIDTSNLGEVDLNVVVRYYNLLNSIMSD